MYSEVTTVVAGAEEDREIFTDYAYEDHYLTDLENDAESTGYRIEVYRTEHDHHPDTDCECAQYVTDHRPFRVFNPGGRS